ncbi:hypothetical protein DID88_010500 [Monilinia fructigena]|uniref:Zn(2)-C6 fungal-type domain-containing protein n=1 Tax=Monilinia fructigena TaxID=38457 RepID=A0A395ILY7_9HELO|nr:hypothetical protein DID88_010500 [Monilinia fructigena]
MYSFPQASPTTTVPIQQPRVRRSRASKPKVKTGCLTCKSRRVKCDEAKPGCMRCARFGHKCEGYAYVQTAGVKPTVVTNIAPRELIPKIGYLPISPSTSPTSVASTTSSILSQPYTSVSPPSTWRYRYGERTVPSCKGPGLGAGIMEINVESRTTLIAHLLSNMMGSGAEVISHERVSAMYLGLRELHGWMIRTYIPQGGHLGSMSESACLKCFSKLELKILRYVDSKPEYERRTSLGEPNIEMMPGRFSNLAEAKQDLESVITKSMNWLASTLKRHDFSAHHNDLEEHNLNNGLFFDIDPKFEEEKRTLREYERWNRSFSPLFEDHQKRCQSNDRFHREKDSDVLLAYLLRTNWLSGYILIASSNHLDCLDVGEGRFSAQLQELREIAKMLRSTPGWRKALEESGNFELETVIPSLVIGWETRDRDLRKISVSMLLNGTRHEYSRIGDINGFSGAVGKVMEGLMEIDEDSSEVDRVPEQSKCRNVEMGFDALARVADLKYYKGDPTMQGPAGLEELEGRKEIVVHC